MQEKSQDKLTKLIYYNNRRQMDSLLKGNQVGFINAELLVGGEKRVIPPGFRFLKTGFQNGFRLAFNKVFLYFIVH